MDITDQKSVIKVIREFQPDGILHLAALTDVDRCEREPDLAWRINVESTRVLAYQCRLAGIRLVYISTGQVFNGLKTSPYLEQDEPDPVNFYGRTKRDGEIAILNLVPLSYIIRTAWLIGGGRDENKFVPNLIKKMQSEREISVVDDKCGSPTLAIDLAPAIWQLITRYSPGTYHLTNTGSASRYQMALTIRQFLQLQTVIRPVSSDIFHLPAVRPDHEILSSIHLGQPGFPVLPDWETSLIHYLDLWRNLT